MTIGFRRFASARIAALDTEDDPEPEDDVDTEEEPADDVDDAPEESSNPLGEPACPYCGNPTLGSPEDNGRVSRLTCDTCGGTAVAAPGDQYMPDLIGSPHNHPSQQPDGRSGGVPGVGIQGVASMQRTADFDETPLQRAQRGADRAHRPLSPSTPASSVAPEHEAMAKKYEAKSGKLTPVKHAGFAGFVEPYEGFHDEVKEVDRDAHGGEGDFDHSLWDRVAPSLKSKDQRHVDEHDDLPDSYHERHYLKYEDAVAEHEKGEEPVAHHRELGQFLGGAALENKVWNKHAEVQKIDPHKQPIYATQPHVVNKHLAKYIRNPYAKTDHEEKYGINDINRDYAGTKHPMVVKHEGNMFAIEGHHRTSAAIHRGEPFHASVWDADKHGLPNEENNNHPGWGNDEDGNPYSGLVHHSGLQKRAMLLSAPDCAYGHLQGHQAWVHNLANHDDGICSLTERHREAGMGDVLGSRHRGDDGELGFHLTASWADVRDKAARITREGGVHIAVSSADGIGGTVRGDTDLYETFLTYVPGSRKVGYWNCGCKWAAYAWGRSEPYRRFEGRMCSHALAMQFEALKQHAFNRKQVEEHDFRPAWMRDKTVVVQHQRATDRAPAVDHRRDAALHVAEFEPADEHFDQHAPVYAIALHGALAGEDPGFLVGVLGEFGASRAQASALVREALDETFLARQTQHRIAANPAEEFRREIMMIDRPNQEQGPGHHDKPEKPEGKNDPTGDGTPDDGSGSDGDPKSHENNPLDPAHFTHQTEDARRHAPDFGWGVPASDGELATCHQCNGQGCGACGGAGQVDLDGRSQIPDQNADTGMYGRGNSGVPTFGSRAIHTALREAGLLTEATYTSYDGSPDMAWRPDTHHTRSDNPGSTGWATSADPASWDVGNMQMGSNGLDPTHGAKKGEQQPDVPTHAGVALKAHDTGRVLMLQRSLSDESDPARGRWEFPGGGLEKGDQSTLHGGIREWEEEVGQPFPSGGTVHHTWRSGPYQGHTVVIPHEHAVDPRAERTVDNPDDDNETVAWLHPQHMKGRPDLRDEVKSGTPWKQLQQASLGKTASWRDNTPMRPDDREVAKGCATCGQPVEAYDTYLGKGFCADHVDESQREDEGYRDRAERGESKAQRWHPVSAIMHGPEPALPFTEGEDDSTANMGATPGERVRADMNPGVGSTETSSVPSNATYASYDAASHDAWAWEPHERARHDQGITASQYLDQNPTVSGDVASIVAAFQASAGAAALNAPTPAQRQSGGADLPGGGDIAAAAAAHLAKTSMKTFSPTEQRSLIMEGEGGPRARNFADLRIEGTHYADLPDDEELTL